MSTLRISLCLFVALAAAPMTAAQEFLTGWAGASPGDGYGKGVESLSDVDQDGVPDYVVSSWKFEVSPFQFTSYVEVRSGQTGALLKTIQPNLNHTATNLTNIGDVDADGVDDWMHRDWEALNNNLSSVFLYSGATQTFITGLSSPTGDPKENFGDSLAGGHDVTGDGVLDLLIGAPGFTHPFLAFPGSVRVYSGTDRSLVHEHTGGLLDGLGTAVTFVPDLDGDLVSDFAASAPQFTGSPGYVNVYSGASGTLLTTLTGPVIDEGFGANLAAVPDLDLDGRAELAVSAPGADHQGTDSGSVYVFSILSGNQLTRIDGVSAGDGFGNLKSVGDVNGDGLSDLAVGSVNSPAGSSGGTVRLFSGLGLDPLYTFGGTTNAQLGFALATARDYNGDGVGDVLAGAPGFNTGPGFAYVLSGNDLFLNADPKTAPAGSLVNLRIAGGNPGSPALLFLVAVNQVSLVYPIGSVVFLDSVGAIDRPVLVPASAASGTQLVFLAFALNGAGKVTGSSTETVIVQ